MKRLTILIFAIFSLLFLCLVSCNREDKAIIFKPVYDVMERTVPGISKNFELQLLETNINNGKDVFELESVNKKIVIKGTSPIALTAGFNWYLKYYCKSSISWNGNNINLPSPLPVINEKLKKESPYQYAYYLNYCTYNYTMSFWDWERWGKGIGLDGFKWY